MTFDQAMQKAMSEFPHCGTLTISIERVSGNVEIEVEAMNWDGDPWDDSRSGTPQDQIVQALQWLKDTHEDAPPTTTSKGGA